MFRLIIFIYGIICFVWLIVLLFASADRGGFDTLRRPWGVYFLGLTPLIAVRIVDGLRTGRIRVRRMDFLRSEDRINFWAMMLTHMLGLIAFIILGLELLDVSLLPSWLFQ